MVAAPLHFLNELAKLQCDRSQRPGKGKTKPMNVNAKRRTPERHLEVSKIDPLQCDRLVLQQSLAVVIWAVDIHQCKLATDFGFLQRKTLHVALV